MNAQQTARHTAKVKQIAADLGFDFCGVSAAVFLETEAPRLEQWLRQNMHGQMHYMANYFDLRLDPAKLVPGAKSVISLMLNYFPPEDLTASTDYKIAKYAYGADYHHVIKDKLKTFMQRLHAEVGAVEGRAFVDSAPVLERVWAQRSGLGWIGKNSLLLSKKAGSFFFLAELIVDLHLTPDGPVTDHCGSCTRCIDACPTEAIVAPYVVDGSKCISYFTIELKDEIDSQMQGKFDNWIFGCDICQDVCPWNRFSQPHQTPQFSAHPDLANMRQRDWQELTEEVFGKIFQKSAVKRAKFAGLQRNIAFVAGNKKADS